LVTAEPEWKLLRMPHLEQLPGVRRKLQTLERLQKSDVRTFAEQSDATVIRMSTRMAAALLPFLWD
jgi:hypothetical protein